MRTTATLVTLGLLGSLVQNLTPWIAIGLLAAAGILAAIQASKNKFVPSEWKYLLLPFVFWTLSFLLSGESLSVFLSPEFQRRDGALFFSLLPIAFLCILQFDGSWMEKGVRYYLVLHAVIALAGAVSAAAGWIWVIYKPALLVDRENTFFGLYVAHNATGSVYCLLAIGALALAFQHRQRRIQMVGIALLLALGVFLSRSRGAFLGLGAGVVILVLRHGLSKRGMAMAISGLLVVAIAGGIMLYPRFKEILTKEGTHSVRWDYWHRAIDDFKRSPVIGVGFGRYNDADREFTSIGIGEVAMKATPRNDDKHAHNSYLHWLAEGGVIGLAIMAIFWALILKLPVDADPIREWILAGIAAMAVLSLTEHYAGGGIFLMHLALLVGISRAMRTETTGAISIKPK